MQHWQKLGKIFEPHNSPHPWLYSHASNPVPLQIEEDIFRIYFSSRDHQNRAYIAFVELELSAPYKVLRIAEAPLLELGEIGAFDDNGMSIGCLLQEGTATYLYYLGWNLGQNVPFRNSIGMAIQKDTNAPFQRVSKGPIVDRSLEDPFSVSYPYILKEAGIYKMWYGSHKRWGKTTSDMIHCLKYATSKDGIHWNPTGDICIDTTETDYAFSKPCVIKENGIYKMWYSFRGGNYRIGYAESSDGIQWVRKDEEVGLGVSETGWDSDMVCYPFVFDHKGQRYMIYNGNKYGKTGFGLAILKS